MTDHTPSPGTSQPGTLVLRTAGTCHLDMPHLVEVFGEQRQRFVAVLRGFGPDDWAAPTRCADWSAHDVVRHLCDATAFATAAGADDRTLDMTAGFDPRITPREYLAASVGESPAATLGRLVTTTSELLACARGRLAGGSRFDVYLPYGPMDWTVLILHLFWDSWIHERDVLLARGTEHPASDRPARAPPCRTSPSSSTPRSSRFPPERPANQSTNPHATEDTQLEPAAHACHLPAAPEGEQRA